MPEIKDLKYNTFYTALWVKITAITIILIILFLLFVLLVVQIQYRSSYLILYILFAMGILFLLDLIICESFGCYILKDTGLMFKGGGFFWKKKIKNKHYPYKDYNYIVTNNLHLRGKVKRNSLQLTDKNDISRLYLYRDNLKKFERLVELIKLNNPDLKIIDYLEEHIEKKYYPDRKTISETVKIKMPLWEKIYFFTTLAIFISFCVVIFIFAFIKK